MEDDAVKGLITHYRFFALVSLLNLGGCAWLQSRQSLFGNEESTPEQKPVATTVPKDQYDQLLKKYEALQTRIQTNEARVENEAMMGTLDDQTGEALLGDLQKAGSGELAETVDVFSQSNSANSSSKAVVNSDDYSSVDVEAQIRNLQTAEQLVSQNKFDESLNLLKPLERSPVRQIRVRARYLVGESLFKQGDFDLSMQIFEEIIEKEAFSGTVIKALGRLIVCSEKLKLEKKKERYYSLLHDFFES